jgi:hypothetical protein
MNSKIDEILNNAKQIEIDSPLISIENLKNSIEQQEFDFISPNKKVIYLKKIVAISALFTIIIVPFYIFDLLNLFDKKGTSFSINNQTEDTNSFITQNENINKSENKKSTGNSPDSRSKIVNNEPKSTTLNSDIFSSNYKINDKRSESISPLNQIQNQNLQNTSNPNSIQYDDFAPDTSCFPITPRILSSTIIIPFTISGLKILELTDEEWEKLVPDMKLNDSTYAFYDEFIFSNEKMFNILRLDTLGYQKENLPFLVKRYSEIHQKYSSNYKYLKCDDRHIKDYSKTQYLAYIGFGKDNYANEWGFSYSPILKYSNNQFYKDYYDFIRNYGNLNYLNHNSTFENNKLQAQKREFEKRLINTLIPVKRIIFGRTYLYWFVPNNEFIDALPPQYRDELKNELMIYHRIIEGSVPPEAACKGIENDSYFEVCRMTSGAIKNLDIYPNPANINTSCKFVLTEPRRITISLHSLDGKYVKEFQSQEIDFAGEKSYSLDLSGLPKSIYLVAVSSEKAEQVVKKLIIE